MTKQSTPHSDKFISEAIIPDNTSFDTSAMAGGEPGLPARFRWRDTDYEVARVLEKWKTTGDCRNGSPEQYVRKHWFRIETADGTGMVIYFDRQPRAKQNKKRWWLATISQDTETG
jgi:phosphoribosylglycinamide formyltransferase-1